MRWPFFERPRVFWPIAVGLVILMAGLMTYTAALESAIIDEPIYLVAGFGIWSDGNFWVNHEHPPLPKLLAGLPLVALDPRLPSEMPNAGNPFLYGSQFVYRNRVPPDALVFAGRLPFVAVTAGFGLVLALWVRRHFGAAAALLALLFYTLDPGILAHGKYAATDMLPTLMMFAGIITWVSYLRKPNYFMLALAGITLGLALASKFSTLVMFGLLPLLGFWRWWQTPSWRLVGRIALGLAAAFLIGVMVLALTYFPATVQALSPDQPRMADQMSPDTPSGRLFRALGHRFNLPVHPYFSGLEFVARHNDGGHLAYLLGQVDAKGWWYYFPVAMAVKTPLALWLALIAGGIILARDRLRAGSERGPWPFAVGLLAVPPVIFLGLAMQSHINIGIRHVLPVYPFLFVVAAVLVARTRSWKLMAVAAVLLVAEHVRVAPHYLAFFNSLAGGPARGPEYLLDSNIDWGQDYKKLRAYFDEIGAKKTCLALFGIASSTYYGLHGPGPPNTAEFAKNGPPDCVVAVSANWLYGLRMEGSAYDWLLQREPDARVGYSIYVFDLRKDRAAERSSLTPRTTEAGRAGSQRMLGSPAPAPSAVR